MLGEKQLDNVFRAVLPIYADNEHPKGEDWSDFITEIMSDIDARIAIVAGSTFELFFMDDVSHKAVSVAQASLVLSDKIGIQLSSLLSVSDFNEANLVNYFDTLYKENLSAKKLDAIIHSIVNNKSKSKDVLRQYLKMKDLKKTSLKRRYTMWTSTFSLKHRLLPNKKQGSPY